MAKDTQQDTVTLPVEVINFVKGLARLGIYGTNKGQVYRHFITEGMHATIKDDVIQKHLATRKILDEASENGGS